MSASEVDDKRTL